MNRKRTNNWRGVFYLATLAILLTPARTSAEFPLYISPGLQIGYTPGKGISISTQVTLGLFLEVPYPVEFLIPGMTIGFRWSKKETITYLDGQLSYLFFGAGLGKAFIKKRGVISEKVPGFRRKAWAGYLLLLTYDRTIVRGSVPRNHFGIMGVLPMPVSDWMVSGV